MSSSERRPSIFDMLHFGIPREPTYTDGSVMMWRMPISAEEEEEAHEKRKRTAATRTNSTLSSLPHGRFNRYRTESEINTIYGVSRENIASRGLSIPSQPPTPLQARYLPLDSNLHEEKHYIDRCLFQDSSGDNFSKMIMQNFFKAPKSVHFGYGMPRPETREGSAQHRLVTQFSRKPSVVRVPSHSSLCKPIRGENHTGCSEEFCEILGPGCCSSCIETTNRQIAEEIQRRLFPDVEVSRRCLVAPKLTKVLKDGHLKQIRRKRLHELRQPRHSHSKDVTTTAAEKTTTTIAATTTATVATATTPRKGKTNNNAPPPPPVLPQPLPTVTRGVSRGESMKLPPINVPHQPTFTPYSQQDNGQEGAGL